MHIGVKSTALCTVHSEEFRLPLCSLCRLNANALCTRGQR